MFSPEPTFATAFSEEHWTFLKTNYPFVMLHWPRFGQLVFLAGIVGAFLAAAELGIDEKFRRDLQETIALTGLIVALYALGIRWLGWTNPPWVEIAADTEQFNVSFFHHNAPSACLNLAWPLLLWSLQPPRTTLLRKVGALVLLGVVSAALPLWHSYSAPLIALGLLGLGSAWHFFPRKIARTPLLVPVGIGGLFLLIFVWQGWSIARLQAIHPDGWTSAEQAKQDAPERDAKIRAAADLRGDRLVASPAPPRPAAWLTALRMAKDYPLVGLGPGAWVTHSALYSNDSRVNTFFQHRQFAHHDLLQTAAEWGGLGALAWLILWIGAFWLAPRRDAQQPSREMGLVLSLLGVALHSTVHFPLQNPALLLWATLLLGLAWSPLRRAPADPVLPKKPT